MCEWCGGKCETEHSGLHAPSGPSMSAGPFNTIDLLCSGSVLGSWNYCVLEVFWAPGIAAFWKYFGQLE